MEYVITKLQKEHDWLLKAYNKFNKNGRFQYASDYENKIGQLANAISILEKAGNKNKS